MFIPITNSLKMLLYDLGYEKFKGTDNFILAPEIKINRTKTMADILSQGFANFYSQLNMEKKLSFKCLRKTYITNLSLYMGGNAKMITGHSDDAVIQSYYINKAAIAKAANGFEIFKETNRKNELEHVRNSSTQTQKEMEVEI